MSLTPHGPSFSFLDTFQLTLPGREGLGQKWLDPQLPFFADHFPGAPLMPGVLLIEAAAQAAGALWASMLAEGAPTRFALAQVLQFKLQHPVLPGAMLVTQVTWENEWGSLAQFSVTLKVGPLEVARGRIVLSQNMLSL